jgi:pimeloyl-ACP methyl ester carboxylesterase
VNDIVAVLDDAGIERAHYWGYSMGGWIGLGMVTQASARVLKAVIGGAHPYGRKLPPDRPDGSNPVEFNRAFYKLIGVDFDSLSDDLQNKLLANDTRAWAASLTDRPSSEAVLPTIKVPCLMYAGQEDGLFAQAQEGAALIPNCRFITVPGNHVPAFWNSMAILPHALKFLAEP